MRWLSLVLVAALVDVRLYVSDQLEQQAAVLDRTRATVDDKLAAAHDDRARRVRAAYRLLRSGVATGWVEPDQRMATARRRAAARWVLARDRREEQLLADEAAALDAAAARLAIDRDAVATAPMPPAGLLRPVRGPIARRFGPYEHERSHATLSRRGVDFETGADADVVAIADGTVVYAGPIRGLENGLVIDHGGWLSVLGKLAPPLVAQGAHVTRGQLVAHPLRRRVYLEVRAGVSPGGVPVDPEQLFE